MVCVQILRMMQVPMDGVMVVTVLDPHDTVVACIFKCSWGVPGRARASMDGHSGL